jgi:hypothetical protein
MQKPYLILLSFLLLPFLPNTYAQTDDTLFVSFWNLQNLFDTANDLDKNDEEYLPGSERDWTDERLDIKLNHMARVIHAKLNINF